MRVHTYTDIEKRNAAIDKESNDFHVLRTESPFGDRDITAHLGQNYLFSAWHSSQMQRIRIDWDPRTDYSKERLIGKILQHYGTWVCSITQGQPKIEANIQTQYKTHGKTVFIPAQNAERHLPLLSHEPTFEKFRGLILCGYKIDGRTAYMGLDTVYDEEWNTKNGMVFVEFDTFDMVEKIVALYKDTAPALNRKLGNNLTQLLQIK